MIFIGRNASEDAKRVWQRGEGTISQEIIMSLLFVAETAEKFTTWALVIDRECFTNAAGMFHYYYLALVEETPRKFLWFRLNPWIRRRVLVAVDDRITDRPMKWTVLEYRLTREVKLMSAALTERTGKPAEIVVDYGRKAYL